MARMFIVEQNALGVGGHYFAYSGCVARAAIAAGLEAVILQNTRQKTDWAIPGATVISAFSRTWGEAQRAGPSPWGAGDLVYEMLAATSSAPPTAGDHVLFHTLGQVELHSVLTYLSKIPPSDHIPTFHVLLRYDPNDLGHTLIALEPVLAQLRSARHLRRAVRFHTDTDQLTRVYARMTRLPFSTLPIPFAQTELRKLLGEETPRAPDAPITFAYLGDARHEKGYHYIPAAISHVWQKFAREGKVRFVLQSNFNVEGGETGQLAAVQRLGQFPADRVRLIPTPMDQAEYFATLSQADVVLIPYSAERYRERSSGVLVEAMAAGKPVITSAGSWMESFVTDEHAVLFDDPAALGEAIEAMIVDFERYRAGAARIQAKMLDWSSGANFVHALLAAETPAVEEDRPNTLIIMNGDAMVLQNGSSQIARSQFEYFSDAGFRVTGLFLTKARRANNEDIEAFTTALLACTSALPMDECHVAAPGRLASDVLAQSVARLREEPLVEADLDLGSYYDYNSSTLRALRRHRPHVVLLNYITNIGVVDALGLEDVPLICEMHDIQSFQKAIYGERAVSARDLAIEIEMLSRCDYLISLNESETQLIRAQLPAVSIRTSGVFSSARPSTTADIAGCKDIAELISSTGPQLPALRYDDSWHIGDLTALQHRLAFPRIDILFVSSSHLANVSGLRWFLDEIYTPYLAPVGVRMVVAGSVFYHGEWPKMDGLLFTGQVEDLAPLYAAARIVVLPIVEGAGSPVKTFEAMRYVRPIVATPMALRGIDETVDGILIASEPHAFAEHVLRLFRSSELRDECRTKIAASTRKLIDPARYRALMNEAVLSLLGETAPSAPTDAGPPITPSHVEWDAETVAFNRVVRSLLDNEELAWPELRLLSAVDPARLRQRMDEIVGALMFDQDAPILRTEARVRSRMQVMQSRFPDLAGYIAPLLCRAIAFADPRRAVAFNRRGVGPTEFTLFHHRDQAVRAITITRTAVPEMVVDDRSIVSSSVFRSKDHQLTVFALPRLPDAPYEFAIRDVRLELADESAPAVVIGTTIRIGGRLSTFGAPLVADQGDGGLLFLSSDRARTLNLPRLGGLPRGTLVVDIFFVDDFGVNSTLTATVFGTEMSPLLAVAEKRAVRRLMLDDSRERTPFGPLRIGLRIADILEDGEGVAVEKIRLSLVAGLPAAAALTIVDDLTAAPVEFTAAGGLPDDASKRLRDVVSQAVAGRPLPLNNARILREIGRMPKGHEALHEGVRALYDRTGMGWAADDGPERRIDTILYPNDAVAADAAGGIAFVAAPGVDFECAARFDSGGDEVTCRIADVPVQPAGRDASGTMRWIAPVVPGSRRDWRHTVVWRDRAGELVLPHDPRIGFVFPASVAGATAEQEVFAKNLYELEDHPDGRQFRWTGPGTTTSFLLPFALTARGEFRMALLSMAENQPSDIAVLVNGKPAFTRVDGGNGGPAVICAALEPEDGPATTVIEVTHRRLLHPENGDTRRLGVCFTAIEVELKPEPKPGARVRRVEETTGSMV